MPFLTVLQHLLVVLVVCKIDALNSRLCSVSLCVRINIYLTIMCTGFKFIVFHSSAPCPVVFMSRCCK